MVLPEESSRLRIYINESDRRGSQSLYQWVLVKAREHGLAGATVLRGTASFGRHSLIHTAKILRLSDDMPVIVEMIDRTDKLEAFLEAIDSAIEEGLATMEPVRVRFYRSRKI